MVVVTRLLSELEKAKFYGSLELKFESGEVVLIRKSESIKPFTHRSTRGSNDAKSENA